MTLGELENYLQSANRDLRTYYGKNKVGQQVAEADSEISSTVAEAKAIRHVLYDALDRLTGLDAADVKARYGALDNLQNEVARAKIRISNRQPVGLFQELGALHGAGKTVSGVLGGSPASMPSSVAEIGLGRYFDYINHPDTLIRRAFENVSPRMPEGGRQPWQPAGLLERGLSRWAPDRMRVWSVASPLRRRWAAGRACWAPVPSRRLRHQIPAWSVHWLRIWVLCWIRKPDS
jgi:hypothetical protein